MERTWLSTTAGALDILSGIPAVMGCIALVFAGFIVGVVPEDEEFPFVAVQLLLLGIACVVFVCAILAFVGGAFALQRRRFGWMVVGAVAAAIAFPPLGVPALILTVIAQQDVEGAGASEAGAQAGEL